MAERIATLLARKQIFSNQTCGGITTGFADAAAMDDFTNRLHEALDFYQLFDTFIADFGEALPFDSIEYKDEVTQTSLISGISGKHRCVYALRYGEQSLGSMSITRDTEFIQQEIDIIDVMLAGLALPLRNALRYQQAIRFAQRDELTGLRNGSYYHDIVELEIERAQRYKKPFSLLLLDLDDFKCINNKYGNGAGDAVRGSGSRAGDAALANPLPDGAAPLHRAARRTGQPRPGHGDPGRRRPFVPGPRRPAARAGVGSDAGVRA